MNCTHATRAGLSALALLLLVPAMGTAQEPAPADGIDVGAMFEGTWEMEGRFRWAADVEWIPTGSTLVAAPKLGNRVVFREIEAPQIAFSALDLITYDSETGVAQYIYVNNESTTALFFEGGCADDDCRTFEFEQVCGPSWPFPACSGRSTITFETDDRFVARDFQTDSRGVDFMSREVYYNRR